MIYTVLILLWLAFGVVLVVVARNRGLLAQKTSSNARALLWALWLLLGWPVTAATITARAIVHIPAWLRKA